MTTYKEMKCPNCKSGILIVLIQGNVYDLLGCRNCDYKAAYRLKI